MTGRERISLSVFFRQMLVSMQDLEYSKKLSKNVLYFVEMGIYINKWINVASSVQEKRGTVENNGMDWAVIQGELTAADGAPNPVEGSENLLNSAGGCGIIY